MRIRTAVAAVVLSAGAAVPLAGTALAQDTDCPDYSTQQEAQAALEAGDPDRLDEDGDGIACESLPGGSAGDAATDDAAADDDAASDDQVQQRPSGGVDTGDGSTSGGDGLAGLLAGAVLVAGAGTALVLRRTARSPR